jgi:cephalosporin hydroxylase
VQGSVTGAHVREWFDGYRWSAYGGGTGTPAHGGTRVIDLETVAKPGSETMRDIVSKPKEQWDVINAFHELFYGSDHTHGFTFYEGVPVLKNPLDLWVVQEIIWDLKPTLIVETGTAYGGSALYYARQLDRLGAGKVVSIDLEPAERLPEHERITYIKGYSSVHPALARAVAAIAAEHPRVMVVLDSDHSKRHVLQELDAYASLVTPGQFLVVEDTNINGRPVKVDWKGGPGPGPAVDEWLPRHPEFSRAEMAYRYMMTFHTWLRRSA